MTTNNTGLPAYQDAYQHLTNNVRAQVLFGRMASYGIEPQNFKEAQDLYEIAGKMRAVRESQEKVAMDQSRFSESTDALNQYLGFSPNYSQPQEQAMAIKQAAAELMQDPAIYNSVLSLRNAELAAQQ